MAKIIIASGPVIVEDGKVLLNKHGDTEFWKFCGGRVENFDIDLEEAARREVQEEMGIKIKIIDTEPFLTFATKNTPQGKIDVILAHWLADRVGDIKPGLDIREWKWLPLEDLKKEKLGPNIIPALRHFNFLEE